MSVELACRNLESTVDWSMPICPEAEADDGRQVVNAIQFSAAFRIEWREETLVIIADRGCQHLGERELGNQVNRLLQFLDASVSGVVVDLSQTNGCPTDRLLGPTAAFWSRLGKQQGRLALCGVCEHGRQVLSRTRLDSIWQVCTTREEALAYVTKETAQRRCAETVSLDQPAAGSWRDWGRNFLASLTS